MSREEPQGTDEGWSPEPNPSGPLDPDERQRLDAGSDGCKRAGRSITIISFIFPVLLILAALGYAGMRYYVHQAMRDALPQVDGSIPVTRAGVPFFGLAAPVTVERDVHGVPHIHASSLDDLVFAQGYVTAQDRLWQMELLRRVAAGDLAEVLGSAFIEHDRLQRTLQMRAAADRAIAVLPADQKHWLEVYARGVNASMAAQIEHLPLEFRVLRYKGIAPWTPRDSLLIGLVMYQDFSSSYLQKLGREAITARLPPELIADLYPVGSWRDHPPGQPTLDLTAPRPEYEDIPLDRSQTQLRLPQRPPSHPSLQGPVFDASAPKPSPGQSVPAADLLALQKTLALCRGGCDECVAGSNNWAVAGSRTVSGSPMLSNDMHMALSIPGLWYEADLEAENPAPMAEFHVAGVTLPGTPFVIAGHNAHVAWGFTNLRADVQDIYIEHTRGTTKGAEYQSADGAWHPLRYRREVIHVRNAPDVTLDVPLVRHGDVDMPIISSIYPGEKRSLSLRWSAYDPANIASPFFDVDSAVDWSSMLSAFSLFGGPALNLVYADDRGHIGYHAVGRIPVRGDIANPSPLSPLPTDAVDAGAASHEWAGYIPFDQLPQAFDPPDGVLATANARITLDGYRYPVTLDWDPPYRTERIYKVLKAGGNLSAGSFGTPGNAAGPSRKLTPADMLALQNDVFSELDLIVAQRLAYSIDHATGPLKQNKTLRQAADILRGWNGRVDADAAAPAIVDAARSVFWEMLLVPKFAPQLGPKLASGEDITKDLLTPAGHDGNLWKVYLWGERSSVEERMVTGFPTRWLPPGFATWEDFLAEVVVRGLHDFHAPSDLNTWRQAKAFPLDIEHPIFVRSSLLKNLIGVPTGTGPQPQSGDNSTVKWAGAAFGPSERFTADLSDPDLTTLNIVLGQSGNVSSPWYMDQFPAWLHGATYSLPFTPAGVRPTITHTLMLTPR
jgi:penicillin amidase